MTQQGDQNSQHWQNLDAGRPRQYERCLVAYLDVLGWSAASIRASSVPGLFEQMQGLLTFNSQPFLMFSNNPGLFQVSDSIFLCLRLENTRNSVVECFWHNIAKICNLSLQHGFLVRGAITEGLAYHDSNALFGPAVVDAVAAEKLAVYPRIVWKGTDFFKSRSLDQSQFIRTAKSDSIQHFDIFRFDRWERELAPPNQQIEDPVKAANTYYRPLIVEHLRAQSNARGKAFEKWRWFATYFNEVALELGVPQIAIEEF